MKRWCNDCKFLVYQCEHGRVGRGDFRATMMAKHTNDRANKYPTNWGVLPFSSGGEGIFLGSQFDPDAGIIKPGDSAAVCCEPQMVCRPIHLSVDPQVA